MARLELRPFREDDLDGAARLLADRHARHRAAEPLLPADDARAGLAAAWGREGASGAVALRGGSVAGYLVGRPAANAFWGAHVFVDRAGHAAAEPELVRDLYAVAAERWAADGLQRHFALVPALDAELDPWYRLSFAQMQLDAIRPSGGATPTGPPAGVTIRRGGPADLDAALPLANLIWEHQALPPAFTGLTPPSPEETRHDWQETLEADDVTYFVAEDGGRAVGHAVLYPPEPDFGVPRDAIRLAATATLPALRGGGIGRALSEHVLAWTADAGYKTVVTDWRVPNLLASRFWPARGFRPTFHRLSRQLGTG